MCYTLDVTATTVLSNYSYCCCYFAHSMFAFISCVFHFNSIIFENGKVERDENYLLLDQI